jgi:hypothetical protein
MSIIPEYVIQQVLVQGIQQIRQDRRILDVLFRNIHQDDLQSIWKFIRDNTIDISINYPDEGLKVPSVTILLRSESESDEFLGDLMQPPFSVQETGMPFSVGRSVASVAPTTAPSQRILMSLTSATGGTSTTLTTSSTDMPLFDPFEETVTVMLVQGTGAGQQRTLVSVTPVSNADTILAVTPAWDTTPDSTTKFEIAGVAHIAIGEPSKVFKAGDVVERIGAHYLAQYQLMIAAQDPGLVIYLYMIIKALMFLNSQTLISQGFLNLKMSGTDYLPRSEYLPTTAYQRSLILDFHYSFDVYSLQEFGNGPVRWGTLSTIKQSIDVHDPDIQNAEDPERIAIETHLDL